MPQMWGYTLSTPEMYKSGDRSLANRPTHIVSVSKISHTLSIDETQCFACKKHPVVVLIVVIVIGLVVDLVNTLFLCITGQPDWTLVDLCPKFSLKPFGIYHQSAILFVGIIFSFLFSFFQRRPAYRRTLPPY